MMADDDYNDDGECNEDEAVLSVFRFCCIFTIMAKLVDSTLFFYQLRLSVKRN